MRVGVWSLTTKKYRSKITRQSKIKNVLSKQNPDGHGHHTFELSLDCLTVLWGANDDDKGARCSLSAEKGRGEG